MTEREMSNFALRDEKGNEIGIFTGRSPHQAALKAANRGHTNIKLRGAGHEEVARIHWRVSAGGQAQGRADLDGEQDLDAHGQEDGHGDVGVALKFRYRPRHDLSRSDIGIRS